MCGIFCYIKYSGDNDLLAVLKNFQGNIKNRGPDSFKHNTYVNDKFGAIFAASVLWLQGESLVEQPIEDLDSVFLYNGDIFSNFNENIQMQIGDTKLMHQLFKGHKESLILELSKVHGPYAFIFFDKNLGKLYFGRDVYGRRSLLLGKHKTNNNIIICSIAKRKTEFDFVELPSIGVFCLDMLSSDINVFTWTNEISISTKLKELNYFLGTSVNVRTNSNIVNQNVSPGEHSNSILLGNICSNNIFDILLQNANWMKNVKHLKCLLENAIKKRISTQPGFCQKCILNKEICNHVTTGVLFSGGVDCAVLALLSDQYVDPSRPIDLINVSFSESNNYESPDRLTGRQTLFELQGCCPGREWNFVTVNVTKEQLNEHRETIIADLIYPLDTILDDSLGCALWFASKGEMEGYTSSSRILLVGMGADELFGGYTKHRAAFKRSSWQGLQQALDDDWHNLPYRNLGRDDRVVSDHGRQLRTPYLDENVVQFVRGLHCWEKTCPSDNLPQGIGEKILLRSLAYHLGLKNAAGLKKRALQFGSRIANRKENAHEQSARLHV